MHPVFKDTKSRVNIKNMFTSSSFHMRVPPSLYTHKQTRSISGLNRTHTHYRRPFPACLSSTAHIMSRSHFLHQNLGLSFFFSLSLGFPPLPVVFLHTQHLGSSSPCFQNKHRLIPDVWILRAQTHAFLVHTQVSSANIMAIVYFWLYGLVNP